MNHFFSGEISILIVNLDKINIHDVKFNSGTFF